MEKRRVRLEINGVVCGLITQESDEYMRSLANELEEKLMEVQLASPYITREAAALTVALNYCDDARKNGQKRKQLQDRVDELEVEAEVWHEERADMVQNGPNPETRARIENLIRRNNALQEIAGEVDELRRKAAALEKEKKALEERAAGGPQLEALHREVEQLREENQRLHQGMAGAAPDNEALLEELEKLAADNAALKQAVEEKESQAQKAEQERQATVSAAKRAVEEAKRLVDEARAGTGESSGAVPEGQTSLLGAGLEEEAGEGPQKQPHKRKNPLRHEEDFEQEGFVSFFEKK